MLVVCIRYDRTVKKPDTLHILFIFSSLALAIAIRFHSSIGKKLPATTTKKSSEEQNMKWKSAHNFE